MYSDEHPWQSAHDEFHDELLPKLIKIGKVIGKEAMEGDSLCKDIIHKYSMLHRSFDPMTYILLKELFEKYERR